MSCTRSLDFVFERYLSRKAPQVVFVKEKKKRKRNQKKNEENFVISNTIDPWSPMDRTVRLGKSL